MMVQRKSVGKVEWMLWLTPLVIRIDSCLHRPLIDVHSSSLDDA